MSSPLAALHAAIDALAEGQLAEIEAIAAIPAPTLEETERAAHVARRFTEAGLAGVAIDGAGSVRGRYGTPPGGRSVLLAAHQDTVYPRDQHDPPRRAGERLIGSSIRDNSAGVAALVTLARALRDAQTAVPCGLEFVATTGEEGTGDLRGIRHRLRPEEPRPDAVLVVDGPLGQVVHQGIAVRRFRVAFEAPGGHSWGNFGAPSAVHALVRVASAVASTSVPERPKTSFNVGVIRGGTSVNSIAAHAEMEVDFRSIDVREVERLSERLAALLADETAVGVRTSATVISDRPGGAIPPTHALVALAREALAAWGVEAHPSASSTDANIPLALGIPAVSVGVALGGNTHAPGEWLEVPSVRPGLHVLAETVWRTAVWVGSKS